MFWVPFATTIPNSPICGRIACTVWVRGRPGSPAPRGSAARLGARRTSPARTASSGGSPPRRSPPHRSLDCATAPQPCSTLPSVFPRFV
jgi:hypothetical protein